MLKKIALSILVSLVSVFALENLQVNGSTRTMIVYAPKNIEKNRPLIIQMHGASQGADYQMNAAKWESIADTARFVIVFPNGVNKMWDISGNSDINFLKAIITEMSKRYGIDKNRVYASGFSMGGMMSYHAANKMGDQIAAIAPVSGYPIGNPAPASARPMPILHIHGTADDVVNYNSAVNYLGRWRTYNKCPSTAQTTKPYPANKSGSAATMDYWGPCDKNSEVRLLTIAGKGHWYSMDLTSVNSSDEIWNFVKRFSLDGTTIASTPAEPAFEEPLKRDSIYNGKFEEEKNAWTFNVLAGEASGNVKDGKFVLDITTAASKNYQVQLYQHNLKLEKDQWYSVSFDASASVARSLEVNVEQHVDPWASYLTKVKNFNIKTGAETFTFEFKMSTDDDDARLTFNAGTESGTLYLDNVSIKKIASPTLPVDEPETPTDSSSNGDKPENPQAIFGGDVHLQVVSETSFALFGMNGKFLGRIQISSDEGKKAHATAIRNAGYARGTYIVKSSTGSNLVQVK